MKPWGWVYLLLNVVTGLGLIVFFFGLLADDSSMMIVGGVLFGLFLLDTALVFPMLHVLQRRRGSEQPGSSRVDTQDRP